jgi:hypothetical protein
MGQYVCFVGVGVRVAKRTKDTHAYKTNIPRRTESLHSADQAPLKLFNNSPKTQKATITDCFLLYLSE